MGGALRAESGGVSGEALVSDAGTHAPCVICLPVLSSPHRHPVSVPAAAGGEASATAAASPADGEATPPPPTGEDGAPPADGEQPPPPADGEPGEQAAADGEGGDGEGEASPPPLNQESSYVSVPQPMKERNSHSAVVIDRDLYIFAGDNAGDFLRCA